jgi:ferrous iron transport protein A
LEPGRAAHVAGVSLAGVIGDRLVELGFTLGAPVRVLRRAPFGGPLQVQVREYVLTLRRAEAAGVTVAPVL